MISIKRIFFIILSNAAIWFISSTPVLAADNTTPKDDYFYTTNNNIMNYVNNEQTSLDIGHEEFTAIYSGENISNFDNSFFHVIQPASSNSSSSGKYYYNTGTSCPTEATYTKYNLLDVVQKGDIIFEATGGFGISGHIAIVEDICTDSNGNRYIRLIEAIDVGVVRSILDDTRYDEKKVTIMHVTDASSDNIANAVAFCCNELGASYRLDFQKDTEAGQTDWYCSELVWAAYKSQGIDIEVSGNGEPGITLRDIKNSSKTSKRAVSKQ